MANQFISLTTNLRGEKKQVFPAAAKWDLKLGQDIGPPRVQVPWIDIKDSEWL